MIYTTTLAKPGDDCITLDGSRLHVIKFKNSSVQGVKSNKTYKIDYNLIVEGLNTPEEKVFFKSTSEHLDFVHLISMDIQRFTDEVYLAIQDKKLPDSTEYIKELKTKSISKFGDVLLKEEGEMTLDTEYKAFGYVYSETDKIGTFEKVKFTSNNNIVLIDTFSIIDLSKTDNMGIEYSLKNKKYIVSNPSYKGDNSFAISGIEISNNNDIEVPQDKDTFASYEDFISHRKQLLDIDAGNNSLSIDEFDDLF